MREIKKNNSRFNPIIEGFAIGTGILIVLELVIHFIYFNAVEAQKGEIFEGMHRTANVTSTILDGEQHLKLINDSANSKEVYEQLLVPLKRVLDSDTTIEFIYTMTQVNSNIHFILDPTEDGDLNGDGVNDKSHIMELYSTPSKTLISAFQTRRMAVTEEVYKDDWGQHISVYVPIYTRHSQFAGILGIDISARTYINRLKPIKKATERAMITTFFIAYLCGLSIWFLRSKGSSQKNEEA